MQALSVTYLELISQLHLINDRNIMPYLIALLLDLSSFLEKIWHAKVESVQLYGHSASVYGFLLLVLLYLVAIYEYKYVSKESDLRGWE